MQNTARNLKLDERNHVEKPLLAQLDELGWDIIDLENKQHPGDSHRQTFTEVVMLTVLHEQLKVINASKEPTYGLHRKKQIPLFRMFAREIFGKGMAATSKDLFQIAEEPASYGMSNEDKISHLVNLTQKAFLVAERELRLTGFWESIPARNKLKAELQKTLLSQEFANLPGVVEKRSHIISRIMEIAEKNNDIILYAE
jgi:type I restriction enzyme R subunit